MGIFLIIISVFASLLEGVFIKKYNTKNKNGGMLFTALISLFSMLFFIITKNQGFNFSWQLLFYAVIAGIVYATASFLTYKALECGSFAMSMLILSYSIIFCIGYGLIFLKEKATLYTYIGFLIIIISLYLTREKKDSKDKKVTANWLFYILVSTVCAGMFGVLQKMQQVKFNDSCNNEFMIISLLTSFILLFTLGIIKDRKNLKEIIRKGSLFAIGAGTSNGITNMLTIVVNSFIPISVASPSRSAIKIITAFLFSTFLFKEKFLKRQIIGVILGTVALVFLNI